MNIRHGTMAVAMIVALGLGGVAVANGQQELAAGESAGTLQGRGLAPGEGLGAALDAIPVGTLQATELASLLYMWEEEKLARDVYTKLGELYRLPVFSNIARSEQTHMDQVSLLLDRYSLEKPGSDAVGVFHDAGLAASYKNLVAKGSESLEQAIVVGITIEEMDIQDLEKAIQSSANQDVQYILNQLQMGSRNHLAAFNRQAQR